MIGRLSVFVILVLVFAGLIWVFLDHFNFDQQVIVNNIFGTLVLFCASLVLISIFGVILYHLGDEEEKKDMKRFQKQIEKFDPRIDHGEEK